MKSIVMNLLSLDAAQAKTENKQPTVKVDRISIDYQGKTVKANRLTVSSEIPISLALAWNNVQTPALLQFVAKGIIRFKSAENGFPKKWEAGKTYGANMYVFGFIPFGGIHYLLLKKVNDNQHEIVTQEWDQVAKVWNHTVVMKDIGRGKIYYEDSIVIYGGILTGFITAFAKIFYKHRQNRWQLVAKQKLQFGE